eukprot:TRINITY_DN26643_c0_g1_i2.p2 TRINITY_DN26643_c0_g1~~TRINITY_DN26643_c0_g1_i2.p2  ORF type:complete len:356 (+),score=119.80 TRINITY_DN26643_c0_g1_i2:65-1132(+)
MRLLTALVLVGVFGRGCSANTLVSYVYYRPTDIGEAAREWNVCAFRNKLCGCSTQVRHDEGEPSEPESRHTLCKGAVCYCQGNGGRHAQLEQCTDNLIHFVKHGITAEYLMDYPITFLFNLVGDTEAPSELQELASLFPEKVLIESVPHAMTDLCTQGNVIRRRRDKYNRFVLINCSARGPYVPAWLDPFENVMRKSDVHLVGPVINCWVKQPHVQSWVWYADSAAADIIAAKCTCDGKRNDQIRACELGVSAALLESGSNIASLQPSYDGLEFREGANSRCNHGKSPTGCSKTDPPSSLACKGAQPCHEVFVKYGGNNLVLGFTPPATHRRVQELDDRGGYCTPEEQQVLFSDQ